MILGASVILVNGRGSLGFRRLSPQRAARPRVHAALALAQTLVIGQAMLGLLLLSERLPSGDKLHFAYGLLPLLAVAYPYALRGDDGRQNILYFSIGSALVAALGVRAYMTGPA